MDKKRMITEIKDKYDAIPNRQVTPSDSIITVGTKYVTMWTAYYNPYRNKRTSYQHPHRYKMTIEDFYNTYMVEQF